MTHKKRIVVGIAGGIAAYKSAMLVSQLVQAGHLVSVVMTPSATKFVSAATFSALTGSPAVIDPFDAKAIMRPDDHRTGDSSRDRLLRPGVGRRSSLDTLSEHGMSDPLCTRHERTDVGQTRSAKEYQATPKRRCPPRRTRIRMAFLPTHWIW